jgi:enamine deaminase RidA (YjgF/YER057c/UK114 family)
MMRPIETWGLKKLCLVGMLLAWLAPELRAQQPVIEGETRKLQFQVAPASMEGNVADQIDKALDTFKSRILNLRAFVVGTDQVGIARLTIEEYFQKKRRAIPTIVVVAVGALPHPKTRVAIEAVLDSGRTLNPEGIAFISGQAGSSDKPVEQMLPLAEKALKDLNSVHRAAGIQPEDVLRVTCLMTSVADAAEVEARVKREFPQAARSFVQLQKAPARGVIECESVARLRTRPAEPLQFIYTDGLPKSPNFSHAALIGAPRLLFSDLRLPKSDKEYDARKTFAELHQFLKYFGGSIKQVAMSNLYPASQEATDLVRRIRFDFYDRDRPPASTMMTFEGLADNASFGLSVIAVKQ